MGQAGKETNHYEKTKYLQTETWPMLSAHRDLVLLLTESCSIYSAFLCPTGSTCKSYLAYRLYRKVLAHIRHLINGSYNS